MSGWPSLANQTFETYSPRPIDSDRFSGSDRDPSTLATAARNGARLLPSATWQVADAADANPPSGAALITNLPYGKRLSDSVTASIHSLSDLLAKRSDLHSVHVVDGSNQVEAISGLRWFVVRRFDNRGLKVRLLRLSAP